MRKFLFFCFAALFLFTACGGRQMPDGIPDDFAIHYADWIDENQPDIFDTYEGYIQKDLIRNGTARVDYTPSDEIITTIYNKIVELELWKMPADVRPEEQILQPTTYIEIRFTMDGNTYEILADSTISRSTWLNKNITAEEGEIIQKFCMFMKDIMILTEEYQSLPDSEGGYM
ncbi:MAG: hypothetical protein IKU40_00085 [Clostridia bacterium]|nr:hypothetical protein [Clostridia bacterium]